MIAENDRIANEKLSAKFAETRAARMAEQELEMANDTPEMKAIHARLALASINYINYLASMGVNVK